MSARLVLNALQFRKASKKHFEFYFEFYLAKTNLTQPTKKKEKVGNLGVRVSEKIDKELFDAILKASKPVKKKKGKKKKKVRNKHLF